MQYETLRQNDDGTIQVRMTIDSHVLEQAFDPTDLDTNVKQGMAIFRAELDRNINPVQTFEPSLVAITVLPVIPPADLLPEAPTDTPVA